MLFWETGCYRKPLTEAEYLEEAFKQPAKKAKRVKKEKVVEATGSEVATIQEEVEDLEADTILPKRTRRGKAAATSQSAPIQPSIPKRKRKHNVRKLKESRYIEDEDQIAEATNLVTRELKKKKPADHPLQPPMIDPIQYIPAAAEGEGDCVGTDLANTIVSSSTPNSLCL